MPLRLFEAFGIELEYMLVDRMSLAVKPISDALLLEASGNYSGDYEDGPVGWSNELVAHVIELKSNGPAPLAGQAQHFATNLRRIDDMLAKHGATLLPTAMHPLMDPHRETVLWPHENSPIYERFNQIFDCRGHGWSNLQSMHVNLPFHGDEEFARLHAAIRFLLPLLPALAASSPLVEARPTEFLDNRMEFYRHNARRVPQISGEVIPIPASSHAQYEREILQPIYEALAPHDPEGVLRFEWANARGCIARFDRDAIEIRVLDIQECPTADLAIAALAIDALQKLCDGDPLSTDAQNALDTATLAGQFRLCLRDAERAAFLDDGYARAFGLRAGASVGEAWQRMFERSALADGEFGPALRHLLERGCLARRILRAVGEEADRQRIVEVYRSLRSCLLRNELFDERQI